MADLKEGVNIKLLGPLGNGFRINDLKDKKVAVAKQDYEGAAKYRDMERKIKASLDLEIKEWESKLKDKRKIKNGRDLGK